MSKGRKPMLILAILLLLSNFARSSNEFTKNSHCGKHKYSPLDCWLWNLQVPIPDQTFNESVFRLNLLEMNCTHFQLTSIESAYVPSNTSRKNPSVDLLVEGISATCMGKYKTTGLSGKLQASVVASSAEALEISLDFDTGYRHKLRMATGVSTKQCQTNLMCDDITFSGSVSAKIINLFKKTIQNYISQALSTQLCPVLKQIADKRLTDLIRKIDEYLLGIISQTDKEVSTKARERQLQINPHDIISWRRDAPFLVKTLDSFNVILNRYLNRGLFLDFLKLLKLDHDLPDQDCGFFYNGLNGFLGELTGGGSIDFDLPQSFTNFSFIIPKYAAMSLELKHLHIDGINHLNKLSVLKPSSYETFWTEFSTRQGLNSTIMLELQVSPIPDGAFKGETLREAFNVSIDTSSLNVSSSVKLKILKQRFTTAFDHVISAFNGSKVDLACSILPIESFIMESFLAMAKFDLLSFVPKDSNDYNLERDIDAVLNHFLSLFLHEYDELVTLSFSGMLNGPIKEALTKTINQLFDELIKDNHVDVKLCHNRSRIEPSADYVNFSNIQILRKLDAYLNSTGAIKKLNNFLECTTSVLTSRLNTVQPKISFEGNSLQLRNLEMENNGMVQKLEILSPRTDYHLSNSFSLGRCSKNTTAGYIMMDCTGPKLTARISIDLPRANMSGTLNLTGSISSFQSTSSALILYDINRLRNLTYADLLSQDVCVVSPAEEATVFVSPQKFGKLFFSFITEINGDDGFSIDLNLNSSIYDQSISLFKSTSSWLQIFIEEYLNRSFSRSISSGKSKCGIDMENQHQTIDFLVVIHYLLPVYILMHILYLVIKLRVPQEERRSEGPGAASESSHTKPTSAFREKNSSLMTKEIINPGVRHIFPVIVVGTMALLFCSNLSTGASVDISISTDQTSDIIHFPSLFKFSMGNTMNELYLGGIYFLLFVVVVFSGIWPYMKCILMLWAWFMPQSCLSKKTRGKLLFAIDALCKFSLVDTYVLVVMMVSFRLHLPIFQESFIVDVFVNPLFGFYGFLLATILSLLAGRFELCAHRCYEESEQDPNNDLKETILSHVYRVNGRKSQFSPFFRKAIISFIVLPIFLLGFGCILKSFRFEFGGLAGAMAGDKRKQTYSLVSLGTSISQSVKDPSSLGILFLQVVYFFFALVMPFLCLLLLLGLISIPMKIKDQKVLLAATEVANSWSAIEVFALSIVAALFQLSVFASFIVGDKCDLINEIIADQLVEKRSYDNTCFSVHAHVSWSALCLVLGAVLNSFVVSTCLEMAQIAVEERVESANGGIERNNSRLIRCLQTPIARRLLFVSAEEIIGEEVSAIESEHEEAETST